jgi:hypothetical protein
MYYITLHDPINVKNGCMSFFFFLIILHETLLLKRDFNKKHIYCLTNGLQNIIKKSEQLQWQQ